MQLVRITEPTSDRRSDGPAISVPHTGEISFQTALRFVNFRPFSPISTRFGTFRYPNLTRRTITSGESETSDSEARLSVSVGTARPYLAMIGRFRRLGLMHGWGRPSAVFGGGNDAGRGVRR
jgi:hypothetical protein